MPAHTVDHDPALDERLAQRVEHLFRCALRDGQVHPLLHLVQRHRGTVLTARASLPAPHEGTSAPVWPSLEAAVVRQRVTTLPPLPQAVQRALGALQQDDTSLDDVAATLACDASLTAGALRLANSPFYGVPGRVTTVRDAAQLLGRRTLTSLVLLASPMGRWPARGAGAFEPTACWRHAIATSIVAGGLARAAQLDEPTAAVAGLMHNLGLLAMNAYFPEALDTVLQDAHAHDDALYATENAHGMASHAEVGGWIAAHWHFPAAVVQAIAGHHRPASPEPSVTDCVHVAATVAHALDVAERPDELVPPMDRQAWQHVKLADGAMLALFEEAEKGVRALSAALAL